MRVAEIRELQGKDTFVVKNIGLYPVVGVESGDVPAVGLAGARLLTETSRVTGLGDELSRVLSAWRRSWAVHDPGKIILDLAVCVALGGGCLPDLAVLLRLMTTWDSSSARAVLPAHSPPPFGQDIHPRLTSVRVWLLTSTLVCDAL